GRVKEHVVEKKKDEMKDYMERAAALIHQYVPPAPERIQAAKDAGRITVTPQAGGPVHLVIAQYLQPGDALALDLESAAGGLRALHVQTWLHKAEDVAALGRPVERPGDAA